MKKFILVSSLIPMQSFAAIQPITIKSTDDIPSTRWMRGQGDAPKSDAATRALVAMKKGQVEEKFDVCAKNAAQARAAAKSVAPWISLMEIDCAVKMKPSTARQSALAQSLAVVDRNPTWLLEGPHASSLRQNAVKGYLELIEGDIKTNRARANKSIDRVDELLAYADAKSKARLWKAAGDIAYAEQKTDAARELYRRSISEEDSSEVRQKISAIDRTTPANPSATPGASPAPVAQETPSVLPKSTPSNEATKQEIELVDRVTASLKSGELVAAVDDAMKIITRFPGGTRASWASDRVMEAYWSVADKTDPKFEETRKQMVRKMDDADADRLSEWARTAFKRGQWEDAFRFSNQALKSIGGTRATALLDLNAKAAMATDKFSDARESFNTLIEQHAGTTAAREALLRSGLLSYRQKDYALAQGAFEKLIANPQAGNLEPIARYWLWRSLQKLKSDRANAVADELIREQPFSYYGLRAQLDRNANVLEFKPVSEEFTSKFWVTAKEKKSWERIQTLLKAGWLEEAQSELKEMPAVSKAEDKAIRAMFWGAAGQYVHSSRLANEAWDEKPYLRQTPVVASTYPVEFKNPITQYASNRKVDPYVVRSLIKQESAYNVRAISSSNALGLMQMIPPTAREIAQDLRLGSIAIPDDLFKPEKNIQMGTYYLSRMITKYQGTVPLALAAYNAGPTRMDRWINSRPSLKGIVGSRSSAPDDELWFDEIPYWETSLYVKSILRNILIYRMLDQGRVEIGEPLWITGQAQGQ